MIKARCPHCGERGAMNPADLASAHECPNCHQVVRLVPENSQRRLWRALVPILIGAALLAFAVWKIASEMQSTSDALR